MENHAEMKDKCDGLETRLDEIAADIRDLPFDYKLIEKYNAIDNDIHKLYEWYDGMKKMLKKYLEEKDIVESFLVTNTHTTINHYIISCFSDIFTKRNIF